MKEQFVQLKEWFWVFSADCRRKPDGKGLATLLLLIVTGLIGNYLNLEFFYSVNFLFGSIATMVAVRTAGTLWGGLVGVVVGSYTYFLWGHPYAIIIFGLEAIVVGFFICCLKKDSMVLIDVGFWLFVGMPLVWIFYTFQLELPTTSVYLIMVKQAINGIINASVASLLFQLTPLSYLKIRHDKKTYRNFWSMKSAINNVLSLFILVPMIISMTIFGNNQFDAVVLNVKHMAVDEARDSAHELSAVLNARIQVMKEAFSSGDDNDLLESWKYLNTFTKKNIIPGLLSLDIVGPKGRLNLGYPQQGTGPYEYLEHIKLNKSNSIIITDTHHGKALNSLHFSMIFPLNDTHYAVASFSPDIFEHQLQSIKQRGQHIELLDGNGIIVAKSDGIDLSTFEQGENEHQLLPKKSIGMPAMMRWRNSYWETSSSFLDNNWKLRVYVPMASPIEQLQDSYIERLLTLLIIAISALIMTPFATNALIRPLADLADAADQSIDVNSAYSVVWPSSNFEEVNQLINKFKNFVETIYQGQEQLIRSEKKYSGMIEAANDAIISIDDNHNITLFNKGAVNIFGYTPDEVLGKPFEILIPENARHDHGTQIQAFSSSLSTNEKMGDEEGTQGLRKNGDVFSAEASISKLKILEGKTYTIILRDNTERNKITDETLRIANELTQLVDTANAPIFGIDAAGKVNEWNQRAEHLTGFAKDDVMGEDLVGQFITDDYKTSVKEVLDKALEGEETANYEFPLFTKTGDRVDVLLNSTTRRDTAGNIVGVIGVGQDITELKETQAQVIQSSKLATLGEMATSVAHELNQPLNVIRMAAGNSRRKISKGTAGPEYLDGKLERIEGQTARAAAIIDHMRMFGRKADEEPIQVDPRNVVTNALDMLGEQLKLADIEVVTEFSDKCSNVLGHAIQMEQVILNLLTNARDAMGKNEGKKMITIRVFEDEEGVHITSQDTGGGILEDVLPRIFEPFYTTKEMGKGTGLGLSVSYGITREMGGTIIAENVDEGARFTITLPVST
jgi:PAS domain S-box-containing protein